VTSVTKSNASRHAYVLWDEAVAEVGKGYPDVKLERVLVDAMAARMVLNPASVDVVLGSNLFADILTDLAAAIQGGMGMAASANLNPEHGGPGMFEPVHGSAPDIAGKGVANPVGAILSGALMLDNLGLGAAARKLEGAVAATIESGVRTRDVGGDASTSEMTDEVIRRLAV
jgi:tartrate dehydrogenase/decarboxylase/D-malate dehydrogenase